MLFRAFQNSVFYTLLSANRFPTKGEAAQLHGRAVLITKSLLGGPEISGLWKQVSVQPTPVSRLDS